MSDEISERHATIADLVDHPASTVVITMHNVEVGTKSFKCDQQGTYGFFRTNEEFPELNAMASESGDAEPTISASRPGVLGHVSASLPVSCIVMI